MKVIFLDFDGVLNSDLYIRSHRGESITMLSPVCLNRLRTVVESTGAKIVLSTSWRVHWEPDESSCDLTGQEIHRIFAAHGMRIYGKTGQSRKAGDVPDLRRERAREIADWLDVRPDVEGYVILDDMAFPDGALSSGGLSGHLVRTAGYRGGLTEEDADLAIEILNGSAFPS